MCVYTYIYIYIHTHKFYLQKKICFENFPSKGKRHFFQNNGCNSS